jgi:hypothetical protein
MSSTYEPIATTTLGSDQTSVTFSSLNTTNYTDLVLVAKASITGGGAASLLFRFNGDTASNYSYTRMYGDGSSAASDRATNQTAGGIGIIGNQAVSSAGTFIASIQNYLNSTTNKTVISRGSDTAGGYVSTYVSLWRQTSTISSLELKFGSIGGFESARSGSTFTLYGIKAE